MTFRKRAGVAQDAHDTTSPCGCHQPRALEMKTLWRRAGVQARARFSSSTCLPWPFEAPPACDATRLRSSVKKGETREPNDDRGNHPPSIEATSTTRHS